VLLCERALWPGEANALPPVGRELIGGLDGMGMLGIITTIHTACGGERVTVLFGGDVQVGGASTDSGSPRSCNAKKADGKREDESRLATVNDFRFHPRIGRKWMTIDNAMARRAGKGLQHHLNNSHALRSILTASARPCVPRHIL
jgi:hypothetical protein